MEPVQRKILLVGDFGVGKSSLVDRFVHNRFSDEYKSTIGVVICKKELEVDGKNVKFLIWDIAGTREMAEVPASYYRGCSALIYVFDLTRQETWARLNQRLAKVNAMSGLSNPTDQIIVVANKSDLCSKEQIGHVLAKVGVPVDVVTSAKDDQNVAEAFVELGRRVLRDSN